MQCNITVLFNITVLSNIRVLSTIKEVFLKCCPLSHVYSSVKCCSGSEGGHRAAEGAGVWGGEGAPEVCPEEGREVQHRTAPVHIMPGQPRVFPPGAARPRPEEEEKPQLGQRADTGQLGQLWDSLLLRPGGQR